LPENTFPIAIDTAQAPPRQVRSVYPEPFASRMQGREKRVLGNVFGLRNFGVNLTRLAPGGTSALRHAHATQDEFVYIVRGYPLLRTDEGETRLAPGMCAGFRAGTGNGHHLYNDSSEQVDYLEVGDRSPNDEVLYPDDDLVARWVDEGWKFFRKNGDPY